MNKMSDHTVSAQAGVLRRQGRILSLKTGFLLAAVCLLFSFPVFAEEAQPADSPSAASASEGNTGPGDPAAEEAAPGGKTARISPDHLPKMDHRPSHHRGKHSRRDLTYDTMTKEELEAARKAAEEEARRKAASQKSSSKKSSSKKSSSKKKKSSGGGYSVTQF